MPAPRPADESFHEFARPHGAPGTAPGHPPPCPCHRPGLRARAAPGIPPDAPQSARRRGTTRLAALVLLAAAALATTGCTAQTKDSATRFHGEQRQVAQTVEDLQDAGSKGHEGKICDDLLARSLVRTIAAKRGSCVNGVKDALRDVDTFEIQVAGVGIRGATATARVSSEHGQTKRADTLTLVKEAGRWKISALGAAS